LKESCKSLFEAIANRKGVLPQIVEKDYWLMHSLWGLIEQGFDFELKGGTDVATLIRTGNVE